MIVLFAGRDIDESNLKVRAGHPLPSRFQQSSMTARSLRQHLGQDAIISLTEDNQNYVLVETGKIAALEREIAQLKQQVGKPKAGGDKKETQ